MKEDQEPRPRFRRGDLVSTMRPIGLRQDGRPIWDLCCGGPIQDVFEREGAFLYSVQGTAEDHTHPEDEVASGGTISVEANFRNNAP